MSQDQVTFSADYLKCPILLDLFEDPVSTSCCGKCISRQPFIQSYDAYGNCPLCHLDLDSDDNPRNLPTLKDMAYLCEEARKNHIVLPNHAISMSHQLNILYGAKLHCLTNNVTGSIIGNLEITSNKKLNFKTLIIPVLDKSGSMCGRPFEQCKYSMNRLIELTFANKHLVTNIITYSDSATCTELNTSMSEQHYKTLINGWSAGGGTSFKSAFTSIVALLNQYKNDPNISSAIIVFLTDGEDSSVTKDNRHILVTELKEKINATWQKDYDLHTIGFGGNHDSSFLDNLRKLNNLKEGAYKFADPQENDDSLSIKINSILDVITAKMIIPIKIISSDINIISGQHTEYWARITPHDCVDPRTITISVNDEEYTILIDIDENQNDPTIRKKWESQLVDDIVQSVLNIKASELNLQNKLKLELIEQRSKAIMIRLQPIDSNYLRLETILAGVSTLKAGNDIDKLKMTDLKFEGKFKSTNINNLSCNVKSVQKDVEWIPKVQYVCKKSYTFIDKARVSRFGYLENKTMLKLLGTTKTSDAINWITQHPDELLLSNMKDANGSNPLVVASAIGRGYIVESMLKFTKLNPNEMNTTGYNALDLSILFGWEITTDLLIQHGAKSNKNIIELFLTCVNNKYFRTADVLVRHKLIVPKEEMISYFYETSCVEFLSSRLETSVGIETAILKSMYMRVQELLPTITNFSFRPYVEIFYRPTVDHIKIFKLLVDNKIADPCEKFTLPVTYEDGSTFEEEVWPLFLVCKRGQYGMFSEIMKHYNTTDNVSRLNYQNSNGNTVLWIACDGGFSDIVSELLGYGVDSNIQNLKGDSALIPACQKGHEMIVQMLLEAGASLDAYNKNRDNPVLICCRSGQAKVLELLFNHILVKDGKQKLAEYLVTYAQIDGFVPLHASTELDKLECIKVCVKYGANLEHLTEDTNNVVKGYTALHLACYYGRINSVMVLIELGANVVAQTNVAKQTPLHIAVSRGHTNIVRYLLSLEACKTSVQMEDVDGRLPSYYANMIGNDAILEEFFTNKLEKLLCNMLISDSAVEKECSQILLEYGEAPLYYEHDGMASNMSIYTMALLNGNQHLINAFNVIDKDHKLLLKNDEFGVPSAFWMKYLGYTLPDLQESDKDKLCIMSTRLENACALGMQNKMLCHLQPVSHKLLESSKAPSIIDKQNSGIDFIIPNSIVTELRKSSTVSYPLLGFMDKLRNSKVFPDGEQILKYIILDAKYNVIRRVVAGETTLEPIHMMALYLYTAHYDIFKQVNMVLKDLNQTNFWFPFINILYKSIDLLEPYCGEVYRAVNTTFSVDKYRVGDILTWNHFSIGSYEWKNSSDMISKKIGIIFIIKSKTGRNISKYSKYPVDSEIVFLPNTTFEITNYYAPNVICLGQANIRNTTFRIREKDIERATLGEASIIVELNELV